MVVWWFVYSNFELEDGGDLATDLDPLFMGHRMDTLEHTWTKLNGSLF